MKHLSVVAPRFAPSPGGPEGCAISTSAAYGLVKTSTSIMPAQGGLWSGDWCEVIPVAAGIIAVSVGDVSGHGEVAYETMLSLRRAVRSRAQERVDPAAILADANATIAATLPATFATALFGYIDTMQRSFTFASAGHPPPLIAGPVTPHYVRYEHADLPLGVDATRAPTLHCVDMPPGVLLVLYTDGVTEHARDLHLGESQLTRAAMRAYGERDRAAAPYMSAEMGLLGSNDDDAAILTIWMPIPVLAQSQVKPRRTVTNRARAH